MDKFLETTFADEGVLGIICTGDKESINSCTGEDTSSARIGRAARSGDEIPMDDSGTFSDNSVAYVEATFDIPGDIGESSSESDNINIGVGDLSTLGSGEGVKS